MTALKKSCYKEKMQSVVLQRVLPSLHTDFVVPDSCRALLFPPFSLHRGCASVNLGFIRPSAGGVEQTNSQAIICDLKKDKKVTQSRRENQHCPQLTSFPEELPPAVAQIISRDELNLIKSKMCSSPFLQKGKK